ncbi:DUF6470 family protein [Parasporobacterium paucivorans]|uniref:Uncharacterized protein n=1 Tax=Parasporobacterium paucivorans DSM 15970 TaxID=1122934 RepID=A0A1M6I663_9FIRM|nr:DUF6470 family protein [Parasporobacterium paucivorans]SHJ29939.1 hypothetical protein SAMN02745691_01690 [Parasporobacterium paucivorans DSM 15970]
MENLLKITTVPIAYELDVQSARLEYSGKRTQVEISRQKGGLTIHSRPARLKMDTFEARASLFPTPLQSAFKAAEKGKAAASEATARYAREGRLMLEARPGDDIFTQIDSGRNQKPAGEFMLGFLPTAGPNIEWSAPDLTMEYQMDKLNFDFKVSGGNFEFVPGDVKMKITQYPDVIIEYIGKPIYAPPSAAEKFSYLDATA